MAWACYSLGGAQGRSLLNGWHLGVSLNSKGTLGTQDAAILGRNLDGRTKGVSSKRILPNHFSFL